MRLLASNSFREGHLVCVCEQSIMIREHIVEEALNLVKEDKEGGGTEEHVSLQRHTPMTYFLCLVPSF